MLSNFSFDSFKNRLGFVRNQARRHRLPGKKPQQSNAKFRKSLQLDYLENRELLAVDVVVGDLLFRGDFTQEAEIYRATAQSIQLGYNPTQGEAFKSLVTITGDVTVDKAAGQLQFKGDGSFAGSGGTLNFWKSASLTTFDTQAISGQGASITGYTFTTGDLNVVGSKFKLENPDGGDTSDSQVKLEGVGQLVFGTEKNGTVQTGTRVDSRPVISYLVLTNSGNKIVSSGVLNGVIYVAGTKWTFADASIDTDSVKSETRIANEAKLELDNFSFETFAIKDGDFVIREGKLSKLNTALFSQLPPQFLPLASMVSTNSHINVKLKNDSVSGEAMLSFSGASIGFIRKGGAGQTNPTTNRMTLTLSGDGIVVKDGEVRSWEGTINGVIVLSGTSSFNVKAWGFEVRDTTIWYNYDSKTFGLTGSAYIAIGIKNFEAKEDDPNGTFKKGQSIKTEANNYLELKFGDKNNSGIEIKDGVLTRLDMELTVKRFGTTEDRDAYFKKPTNGLSDTLLLWGLELRVNKLGVIYNDTGNGMDLAFYGNVALSNNSNALKGGPIKGEKGYDQGWALGAGLGTREKPGLFISQDSDGNYDWEVNNLRLEYLSGSFGGFSLRNLVIDFKRNTNDPNINEMQITVGVVVDFSPQLSLGGSITLKTGFNKNTGAKYSYPTGFSVEFGVPLGGTNQGWMIKPGIYFVNAKLGVDNFDNLEDLRFRGEATFSIGPMLAAGLLETRPVHTFIVNGSIDISSKMIQANVNWYLLAFYDQQNDAAGQDPWKPIAGSGKGELLLDWTNNVYQLKFNAQLFDLIQSEFLARFEDDGFLLYASVNVGAVPYGRFDFWPVNLFNFKGTAMLLLTSREKLFGAWVQLKIIFWTVDVGVGYDFQKDYGFLMGSGTISEFEKLKSEFLEESEITRTYSLKTSDVNADAFYSSTVSVNIPFYSADITLGEKTLKKIEKDDIKIKRVTYGAGKKPLPDGISYNSTVEYVDVGNGDVRGNIRLDFFPNTNKAVDYSKTFKDITDFASSNFQLNIDVGVNRYKTFLNDIGAETRSRIIDKVVSAPDLYYLDNKWIEDKTIEITGKDGSKRNVSVLPDETVMPYYQRPVVSSTSTVQDSESVYSTTFQFDVNNTRTTKEQGIVSFQFAEANDISDKRWTVMRTGKWQTIQIGNDQRMVADGDLVVPNFFTTAEKDAARKFGIVPRTNPSPDPDPAFDPYYRQTGAEVLFLAVDGYQVRELKGIVQSYCYSTKKFNVISEGLVYRDLDHSMLRDLWVPVGSVKLKAGIDSNLPLYGIAIGQYYQEGFEEKDDSGKVTDYYEMFGIKEQVILGSLPPMSDTISPNELRLENRPDYIDRILLSKGRQANIRYHGSDEWNWDLLSVLTVSESIKVISVNGNRATPNNDAYNDSNLQISLLNQSDSTPNKSNTITWNESELTPTTKYSFVVVNDRLGQPVYSDFTRFQPTPSIAGRVVLKDAAGKSIPESGIIAFIDTNQDGIFQEPEQWVDINGNNQLEPGEFVDKNGNGVIDTTYDPFCVTNDNGLYYFYDIPSDVGKVTFVLPGNRDIVGGGNNSIFFSRIDTTETLNLPDLELISVYPVVQGRVVLDTNFNGVADPNEPGFGGAKILIAGAGGKSGVAYTDANGSYIYRLTDDFGATVRVALDGSTTQSGTILTANPASTAVREIANINYKQPSIYSNDFQVESQTSFDFDSSDGIANQFMRILRLLRDGNLTGINFKAGGLVFNLTRFELLSGTNGEVGLKSALGWVNIYGHTLNFELTGPRGLVLSGVDLKEINLRLNGDFDIFGAKLDLTNLTCRFLAGDRTSGTRNLFQLTGSTTIEIAGNTVGVELSGTGLEICDGVINSLNIKLVSGLKIAGETIDLGSLSAVYSKADDKLTLTGVTQLLTFGSEADGNYIGLQNVVIQIGLVNGLSDARILSLQATVAGGLSFNGISFEVDQLTLGYSPELDQINITGNSQLSIGQSTLKLSLPSPGIQIKAGQVELLARATGELNVGNFKFGLDSALVSYSSSIMRIAGNGSFYDGKTQLAMVGGQLSFKSGEVSLISGKVSGTVPFNGFSLDLQNLESGYNFENNTFDIAGSFQVSLIDKNQKAKVVRVGGSLTLIKGDLNSLTGVVETGDWTPFNGFTIRLNSLRMVYKSEDLTLGFSGEATANLLDNPMGLSIMSPGMVWKDGAFSSFGGGITGSIGLERDSNGKVLAAVYAKDLGFLYETESNSLTLRGKLGLDLGYQVGGSVQTDSRGMIFDSTGLQRFSLFGSAGLNFGESFEDTNGDFIRQDNESYKDANNNGRYDFGFAISVNQLGLSYTPSIGSNREEILLSGKGALGFGPDVFKSTTLISAILDFTNPGIRIMEGKIQDFSVGVQGKLGLKDLQFSIGTGCGVRWVMADERLDLWGNLGFEIEGTHFGVVAGTTNSPGFSLQKGDFRLNAGISGRVKLDGIEFTLKEAGILFDSISEEWGVYGSLTINLGVWVEAALGSQSHPGFQINTSDPNNIRWKVSQLTLGFGNIPIYGVTIREVRFSFAEVNNVISIETSCGVQFQGWGLAGRFAFKDGVISQIYVQADTQINIPSTPIFITRFAGSIENIDFSDLSKLTFTAMVGIAIGPNIDLSFVPLIGGQFTMAQFNGRAIISPGGMRIQADAYLMARESGPLGNSTWKGYLGRGTAGVTLNWADHQYYADVDMALNTGGFGLGIPPLFEARFRGRMNLDGSELGFSINASATLQIAKEIPFAGGKEITGASFLLEIYPNKQVIDVMAWFTFPWLEFNFLDSKVIDKKIGLQWDLWNNRWNELDDAEVQSRLDRQIRQTRLQTVADQPAPQAMLTSASLPRLSATTSLMSAASIKGRFAYTGYSSPVPNTDVTEGKYTVNFEVSSVAAKRNVQTWLGKIAVKADAVQGSRMEYGAPIFDNASGRGSITVRILPLVGQYLPRGIVFKSQLISPIALKELKLESSWTNAFEYSGALPAIGADPSTGLPTVGLNVPKATYSIEFKPIISPGKLLPADWLESIRVYLQSIPGVIITTGLPVYDSSTNTGRINVVATPENGAKYLPTGVVLTGTLRSKVALGGLNDLNSPDVSAYFAGMPSEVDAPDLPAVIDNNPRVIRLSGRVNDPRLRKVTVGLYYSKSGSYLDGSVVSMADSSEAIDLPIDIKPDGTWSIDINWDPSSLPSGKMWLYGVVDEDGPYEPVHGQATSFIMQHDIEGMVRVPGAIRISDLSNNSINWSNRSLAITAPESGVRVFADLNNNGNEDDGEPVAITDQLGRYSLDIPGEGRPVTVIVQTPGGFTPAAGYSAKQIVDITRGPVQFNLNLVPTSTILRGQVVVAANKGQSVGGIGVQAKGPDGRAYQATTDIFGEFLIPVSGSGPFTFDLDSQRNSFYNFTTSPLPGWKPIVINPDVNGLQIIDLGEIQVNSKGQVEFQGDIAQGTMQTLIAQANAGYINQIGFSDSLSGQSIALKGAMPPINKAMVVWDQQRQSWTESPVSPQIGPDGLPDNSYLFGPNAILVQQNLKIDGGNLGITLQGDGASRAFLIRPGVVFSLANLTLDGFVATGSNGAMGVSGMVGSGMGAKGGGAGLGGAILNMGITTVENVVFVNNQAIGGNGGAIPVVTNALSQFENAISFNGANGEFGGQGGKAYPVTITYMLPDNPTAMSSTVIMSGAGGGGSGLGGAIFNTNSAVLSLKGITRFISNKTTEGKGGTAPDYVTNLVNSIVGDDARTIAVGGFGESSLAQGQNGKATGDAIFNNGGVVIFEDMNSLEVDAPIAISLSNLKVAENNPKGAIIGTLSTVVKGQANIISYSLVSSQGETDNSFFSIVNNQLVATRAFNYEEQSKYSIRVRATSPNGLYTEQSFVISVINRAESQRPIVTIPRQFTVMADNTSPLLFTGLPFADLVAKASQIFSVSLRVRVGALTALSTTDVAVTGTSTSLTFKGTLSALNAYFTSQEGRIRYTPLTHSTQSRVIQIRISKSEGGRNFSSVAQGRIGISSTNQTSAKSLPRSIVSPLQPAAAGHSTNTSVIAMPRASILRHIKR